MNRPNVNASQTVERLMAIFREQMHLDGVHPDTPLFESGMLDSLGLVNLLVHLEDTFGFQVNMAELELDDFQSIEQMAIMVDARLAHNGPGDAGANRVAIHAPSPATESQLLRQA